ncbi:hypothetical protein N7466_005603 [Penicillium verhagenii]|uniref:uncharacterized protein n=1 Tax=Penicillium verhagenii TaxID=1562060 RepID=UPI0025457575|nr:uncharacterized protein N7466_005603 [Penicillium verhagenii]KAJ5930110.1 hypothetical protein N7466_005603 [Penicillium verhagenii]
MSMDAGGLAQMTYNNSFNDGSSLGVPGSGFASRGKGSHIKRLSVPPQVATIDESQASASISTPRTSRSHLLAGLRTAPKSATIPSQQQRYAMESGRTPANRGADRVPQTATGAGFPQHAFSSNNGMNAYQLQQQQQHIQRQIREREREWELERERERERLMYTMPEQVLAPPMIDIGGGELMDENLYAELMSTNLFLAAQQQRLQQQLISVTAAAQQFQGLNLGMSHQQQQMQSLMPGIGYYQQQLQQGMQPIVQPVPSQPGLFSVYNPMTGQQSYIMDNSAQEDHLAYHGNQSDTQVPQFRAEISPPADSTPSQMYSPQPVSPPSGTPSPPIESSASAFRRNHRKSPSFNPTLKTTIDTNKANAGAGTGARSAVFPPTPATGTFGPGQGRAGEHPIRQPRGPPSLEDLVAKPTSQHEGSKNFATRQRRRAVHNLVRAGIERRGDTRSYGYNSSGGTNTPASEKEFTFSDGDDATVRSGSLSSKPSLGSLRAAANGAIGSERKEKTSRRSPESPFLNVTPTSEDGYFSAKFAEARAEQDYSPTSTSGTSSPSVASVVAGQGQATQAPERRKTPMLVLSSAEKRKTPLM